MTGQNITIIFSKYFWIYLLLLLNIPIATAACSAGGDATDKQYNIQNLGPCCKITTVIIADPFTGSKLFRTGLSKDGIRCKWPGQPNEVCITNDRKQWGPPYENKSC